MGHRATVNQVVQVGPETTPGTAVPAGKLLTAFTWTFGDKPTTKQFTGSGRQYPSASELLFESSAGKFTGQGDFNQLVYPISSCFGPVTAVAHAPSVTAYDWAFKPPISGPKPKKTFTLQNGDTNDAEQYAFVYVPGWGYSFTRKQEVQVSGDWASQTFTDGISLTASPTEVALQPMTGAQANVYLDSTSAGIGTTLLTAPLKVDFKASNFWLQFIPINRANASFTDIIDGMPKNELKLTLEADSTALGLIGTYLRTGVRAYVRVDVQGPLIDVANSVHAEMKHDMALFMSDAAELSDVDGVYAIETTWQVAEDVAWASGQSQVLTLTNLLSAL